MGINKIDKLSFSFFGFYDFTDFRKIGRKTRVRCEVDKKEGVGNKSNKIRVLIIGFLGESC